MPKRFQKKAPPSFLTKKLDSQKMTLIRKEFPVWLKQIKEVAGYDPQMTFEYLVDFIDHLGFKSKVFQGIDQDALSTSDKGTLSIYDFMRKKMGKPDEKQY